MRRGSFLLVAIILAFCVPDAPADGLPEVRALTLTGQETNLIAADAKATVFLFLSVDCPISNSYAPEIRRLHDEFAPKGVAFRLVYPVADQTPEQVTEHLREYNLPAAAFRDPDQKSVAAASVRVTPETAVFVPGNGWIYRGRIDDRHVDFGKKRPAATKRDLREILAAVIEGKPVIPVTTRAVGCHIPSL